MDFRKAFGTVKAMETEGFDLQFGPDTVVRIARAGGANVRYENAMRKHSEPYRRAIAAGTLDDDLAQKLWQRIYAESIVLGWSGVEIDDEPIPYTVDNAIRLFNELPEFWRIVREEATKLANFRQEDTAEMGKASPTL